MLLLQAEPYPVHSLAFSPDGRLLAAACGRTPAVVVWDLVPRGLAFRLTGPTARLTSLAFAPAPALALAAASADGAVYRWGLPQPGGVGGEPATLAAGKPLFRAAADLKAPPRLGWASHGRTLACTAGPTTTWQQEVGLYQVGDGLCSGWPTNHFGAVSCLAFSPGGKLLATGSYDRTVRLAPVTRDAPPLVLNLGREPHFLAFTPDGRVLAAGCPAGLVKLFDSGGQGLRTLKGQGQGLAGLCFSPDGQTVATASESGTVRFWGVATGKERAAFDWRVGATHCVAFAPDGQRAAAGGDGGRVIVWDVDDWGV